jgi:hypothetical protein
VTAVTRDNPWRELVFRFRGMLKADSGDAGLSQVFRFRCQSRTSELPFLAEVEAGWRPTSAQWPDAVVRSHLHQHLRMVVGGVCRSYSVLDAEEAQSQVNLVLDQARWVQEIAVELVAMRASLAVDPEVLATAREQEQVVRDSIVFAARHQDEVNRMLLLRDTVLLDGGMARLWWLDGDRARLQELVKLGDLFEDAARLIAGTPLEGEAPATHSDVAADLIGKFLVGLEPHYRLHLLSQLSDVFRSYERPALATEVEALRGEADSRPAHPHSQQL